MPHRINLYDAIDFWGWNAQRFVEELRAAGSQDIELHINSPGGDVFEGFAIANALRTHQGKKVCIVDGICASAATFPAVVCDEIVMYEAGMLMVHDPWGVAMGGAEDLEAHADVLRKITDQMVALYVRKTKASEEQVRAWISAETWFKPDEAKVAGFCDRIAEQAAKIDARAVQRFAARWRNPPQFQAQAKTPPPSPPQPSPSPRGNMDRKQIILTLASALALAHEMATAAASSGDTELADIGSKILGADKLPACSELVMPLAQKEGDGDAAQAREILRTYAAAVKLTGKTEGVPGALEALAHNAALKIEQHQGAQAAEVEQLLAKAQAEFKLTPARCEEWRAAVKSGDRNAADLRSFLATALPAGKVSADPVQGRNDTTSSTPKQTDGKPSDPAVASLTDFDLD